MLVVSWRRQRTKQGVAVASEIQLPDAETVAATLGSVHRVFVSGDGAARQEASDVLSATQESAEELLPVFLSLVDHPDAYVRAGVAGVLAFADPEPSADGATVHALVRLTGDDDQRVRDWAATSLGGLNEVDSPAIRHALRGLLDEPDTTEAYPAAEAARALAVRGDTAVVEVILSRLDDTVGKLWLTAAAVTGSPLLLDRLRALQEPDEDLSDPWVLALHDAIARCSPEPSGTGEP
jgi:HEAT repeat protein